MQEIITWDNVHEYMNELRVMARRLLKYEGSAQSIQPTDLIVTALRRQKRVDQEWNDVEWNTRDVFFGKVYAAMRRALIDRAKKRKAKKRNPDKPVYSIDDVWQSIRQATDEQPEVVIIILEVMEDLRIQKPELVRLFEHRIYNDLTRDECARIMGISAPTVDRWLKQAKLIIAQEVNKRLKEKQDNTGGDDAYTD